MLCLTPCSGLIIYINSNSSTDGSETIYDRAYVVLDSTATISSAVTPTAYTTPTSIPYTTSDVGSSEISTSSTSPAQGLNTSSPPSSSNVSKSNELSTGAKVGIGVGVTLAAVLAIVLLFMCLRKRKHTTRQPTDDINTRGFYGKPELEGSTPHRHTEKQELEANLATTTSNDKAHDPQPAGQISTSTRPAGKGGWPAHAAELPANSVLGMTQEGEAYPSSTLQDTPRAELDVQTESRMKTALAKTQTTESETAVELWSKPSTKKTEVDMESSTSYKTQSTNHLNLVRVNPELEELRLRESQAWGGENSQ